MKNKTNYIKLNEYEICLLKIIFDEFKLIQNINILNDKFHKYDEINIDIEKLREKLLNEKENKI